ncbi:SDR family oxidoreductase [Paenibacillus sp. HWE-109]|uniref:NAD(P)-dependent oxidoreductase n=1 Tax=Paenibacillus sp. HWE-109 TaxID=1306526 RepID=UPI001EDF7F19|nr:SDR family oxidoreductase [Paenibacillus sp. HWE-109]UKS29435.1 SDR family oxidoreductase [Paenibacillus sp. HWE-109]
MKIVVFGATGGTGRQVVTQAIELGHEVTVIARKPEAVNIGSERLEVIQGDVLDLSSFSKRIIGQDAVISALGVNHRKPTTVYSEGTENIIKAMGEAGVRRFIGLSSSGLKIPDDMPWMVRQTIRFVIQPMFKYAYEDMARMEEKLRKSGLIWTVIRPPRLTNGPLSGAYRTALNQHLTKAQGISRADLASYMIKSVQDSASYQAIVEISN